MTPPDDSPTSPPAGAPAHPPPGPLAALPPPIANINWPILAAALAALATLVGGIGWLSNYAVRTDRTEQAVASHTHQLESISAQVDAAKQEVSGLRMQGARIEAKVDMLLQQAESGAGRASGK